MNAGFFTPASHFSHRFSACMIFCLSLLLLYVAVVAVVAVIAVVAVVAVVAADLHENKCWITQTGQ